MAYMHADTAAKIGFRPYAQTDAFGAAHLSGLGQNHPFKPEAWQLHGLGTYHLNRPFDPWELYSDVHETAGVHGLGNLGSSDPTADAADELHAAGQITTAEHDAIIDGSMTFSDVIGYDPTDQSSWLSLTSLYRQVNQDLQTLEQQFHDAYQPGVANPALAAFGQQLIAQRTQYSTSASQFVYYYTLVMGSAPSGLSGLGLAPIIWVAGAAVFIVTAFTLLYGIHTWAQSVNVQKISAQAQQTTATSTAATNQTLTDALKVAQAKGDTTTAQAILATLQKTAAPQTPAPASAAEQFLMTNWQWLALAAGGLIMAGPISSGLFGGRRR